MSQSEYLFSNRRAHVAALVAIIVTAFALRVSLAGGYSGLDDAEYARFAHQIANGTFSVMDYGGPPVFPLRVGLIYPTSLVFRMRGLSEWSMVTYPLILSVLALPLVYLCTLRFFGHRAGLIAVVLLGIMPIELRSATNLLPDMPGAFYAALGVTVIAFADHASTKRGSTLFFGGCVAGLSFGLSWLCKESISYLVPFCLAYMAISFRRDGRIVVFLWAGVAAGSLAVLLGEMVAYQYVAGDPLFRFHEVERNYRQLENGFFTEGSAFGWQMGESYARAVVKRLFVSGPAMLLLSPEFLFLPLLGSVAALHGWYSKDKSFLIPAAWLATLLLMFNFSSTSLSSYLPLPLFDRYFFMIVFPSVVLMSGFIGRLVFGGVDASHREVQRERRFWGTAIAFALLIAGGYHFQSAVKSSRSSGRAWAAEVRSLGATVKPSTLLYSDTLSLRGLEFFAGYPKKSNWIDFANVASLGDIRLGSLVLVNKAYIGWLNTNAGMWLSPSTGYQKHEFYENPPPAWELIWDTGNARLYRVGRR